MKGNVLVGQSGGPTAVINASLAGVIAGAADSTVAGGIGTVYGMPYAIEGFLNGHVLPIPGLSRSEIDLLSRTPSSALGSCRHKLQDEDLPVILKYLKQYDIRYLFYIGGNDTMDTIHRIESYCTDHSYELSGVGIPKTVDNDLYATDHTPGYPSAARYVTLSVQQAGRLAADMRKVDQFTVYQTVGREAGWLAAASALARKSPHEAPHIIYVPEQPITRERVFSDVERVHKEHGYVYLVAGEGILWEDGSPVSQSVTRDGFANVEFGAAGGASAATTLHRLISDEFGFRGEFQIPESMAMAAADRVVETDREEAFACGKEAVSRALAGESGIMITIDRDSNDPYSVAYRTAPLHDVAVRAKPMPPEFLKPGWVSDDFIRYASPLVGDVPDYFSFSSREDQ